jgi:hypothetical protein
MSMLDTYNFYANNHEEGEDNKYSEGHEFESLEDAKKTARQFLFKWRCGYVSIQRSRDSKIIEQVFHQVAMN